MNTDNPLGMPRSFKWNDCVDMMIAELYVQPVEVLPQAWDEHVSLKFASVVYTQHTSSYKHN